MLSKHDLPPPFKPSLLIPSFPRPRLKVQLQFIICQSSGLNCLTLNLADRKLYLISCAAVAKLSAARYFVNQATHQTSWDRPSGPVSLPPPLPAPSQQCTSLPQGWTVKYDPKSQRPYYHNSFTNHSTWFPPAATADVSPPLQSLPDGWRQDTDGSGNVLFVNDRLQIVQVNPAHLIKKRCPIHCPRLKGLVHWGCQVPLVLSLMNHQPLHLRADFLLLISKKQHASHSESSTKTGSSTALFYLSSKLQTNLLHHASLSMAGHVTQYFQIRIYRR